MQKHYISPFINYIDIIPYDYFYHIFVILNSIMLYKINQHFSTSLAKELNLFWEYDYTFYVLPFYRN